MASPPRHAIVYSMITNQPFAAALNNYTLQVCRAGQQHHALLTFWAGNMVEATSGALDLSRSGRKSVQSSNEQDVLLRTLPILNEALPLRNVPELRLGCYMVLIVLANKAELNYQVLTRMMEAVTAGWSEETALDGLVCLAVLAERQESGSLPAPVAQRLIQIENLADNIDAIAGRYRVGKLSSGLIDAAIKRVMSSHDLKHLSLIQKLLRPSKMSHRQILNALKSLFLVVQQLDDSRSNISTLRHDLSEMLLQFSSSEAMSGLMDEALRGSGIEPDMIERKLQCILPRNDTASPERPEDEEMLDASPRPDEQGSFDALLDSIPTGTREGVSFLRKTHSSLFDNLARVFIKAAAVAIAKTSLKYT